MEGRKDRLWRPKPPTPGTTQSPPCPHDSMGVTWEQHLPTTSLATQCWVFPPLQQKSSAHHKGPFLCWLFVLGPVYSMGSLWSCWRLQDRPLPALEGLLYGHKDLPAGAPGPWKRLFPPSCNIPNHTPPTPSSAWPWLQVGTHNPCSSSAHDINHCSSG